jgi:hypothetical protein
MDVLQPFAGDVHTANAAQSSNGVCSDPARFLAAYAGHNAFSADERGEAALMTAIVNLLRLLDKCIKLAG